MDEEHLNKIKELRNISGCPITECQLALENSKWNINDSIKYLINKFGLAKG
jgi:translation elongation factor EF-Ts